VVICQGSPKSGRRHQRLHVLDEPQVVEPSTIGRLVAVAIVSRIPVFQNGRGSIGDTIEAEQAAQTVPVIGIAVSYHDELNRSVNDAGAAHISFENGYGISTVDNYFDIANIDDR
jgi:hypothetical protein